MSDGQSTAIATIEQHSQHPATTAFSGNTAFENAQRMAKLLSQSRMVPTTYQNNIPDALVALEIAQRTGSSPLMVMQNLHVIHGRPSWSSQFVIAALNSCGRFQPLQYRVEGEGDGRVCVAWTRDRHGNVLEGPPVSIQMAKDEGWYGKNGSKWKTMPELMLRYRAAKFFGNLYAPDVLMGMDTSDEAVEIEPRASDIVQPITEPDQQPTAIAGPTAEAAVTESHEQTAAAAEPAGVPLINADGEIVQGYRRIGDYLNALEKLAEQGSVDKVLMANADALDRIAAERPKSAERIAEIRAKLGPQAADDAPPAQETATDTAQQDAAAESGGDNSQADDAPPADAGPAGGDDDWF